MNMARTSQNIAFTVPPVMAKEFEQLAQEEQSTKSELFRRIFRFYQSSRRSKKQTSSSETDFDAWVENIIFDAVEEKKSNPMSVEETFETDEKLLRYGAERAQALGITTEEQINDIVYEERQKHR
jgi:hypothetical protein